VTGERDLFPSESHIMTEANNRSLVVVYSSPTVMGCELVRSMLAAEGIHATATEANEPFAGLPVVPSEVLVWEEDEARARALIQEAELHHHERVASEEAGVCDADREWN
jgi:hypothetical protein